MSALPIKLHAEILPLEVLRSMQSRAKSSVAVPAVPASRQRWRLRLAYDGTDYVGWQRQPGAVRTVQGELDRALSRVFRHNVLTVGASRTDRGVHARGQACHFDAPTTWADSGHALSAATALKRLRRELPPALLALELSEAPSRFHARLSATRKLYSYNLATQVSPVSPFDARFRWHCGPIDSTAASAAAESLSGKLLDYAALSKGCPEPGYHGSVEKTVSLTFQSNGEGEVIVWLACDRFLYRMARRIVGAIVEAGKGRLSPDRVADADRAEVPTAPAHGLFLEDVQYPDVVRMPAALTYLCRRQQP